MDGHKFIPDVVSKGVCAVIVEKDVTAPSHVTVIRVNNTREALAFMSAAYFGYPAEQLETSGITGTKGKTTTTYIVRSILENSGFKTGLIGRVLKRQLGVWDGWIHLRIGKFIDDGRIEVVKEIEADQIYGRILRKR